MVCFSLSFSTLVFGIQHLSLNLDVDTSARLVDQPSPGTPSPWGSKCELLSMKMIEIEIELKIEIER